MNSNTFSDDSHEAYNGGSRQQNCNEKKYIHHGQYAYQFRFPFAVDIAVN